MAMQYDQGPFNEDTFLEKRQLFSQDCVEDWRDVFGYEGLYQISTFGRIKTYRKWQGKCYRKSIILKQKLTKNGYLSVMLSKDNIGKYILVHRVVALAFIATIPDKTIINHRDGVKTNNHVANLEWVTIQENIDHAWKTGLNHNKGERVNTNKLTEKEVLHIRSLTDISTREICKLYPKVYITTIQKIIARQTWKHI